jgi:hypothetical protein
MKSLILSLTKLPNRLCSCKIPGCEFIPLELEAADERVDEAIGGSIPRFTIVFGDFPPRL